MEKFWYRTQRAIFCRGRDKGIVNGQLDPPVGNCRDAQIEY